jgi:hypothetical protein
MRFARAREKFALLYRENFQPHATMLAVLFMLAEFYHWHSKKPAFYTSPAADIFHFGCCFLFLHLTETVSKKCRSEVLSHATFLSGKVLVLAHLAIGRPLWSSATHVHSYTSSAAVGTRVAAHYLMLSLLAAPLLFVVFEEPLGTVPISMNMNGT